MGLRLVTPPDGYPVTLDEAKVHLNVDFDDDDELIQSMIAAATSSLDGQYGQLGRCLLPQTWDLLYDEFPSGALRIPLPPLISVESVNYVDSDGFEQVWDAENYEVDYHSYHGWIVPMTSGWPTPLDTTNAVRVRYIAGYADIDSPNVSTLPPAIKHAILLMVRDLYDNRGSVIVGVNAMEIPGAIKRLLDPYYVIWVA